MESALSLLARLRLGREEYCQRLLTQLILGGPYPKWNTASGPSPRGREFLARLDALSFGTGDGRAEVVFVDEFDLPARSDAEPGGAPDYACLWPDRVWMVELKTEVRSHREGQLPLYVDLATLHYPERRIDLTYLTPLMGTPTVDGSYPHRFAHLTWQQAMEAAEACWGTSPDPQDRDLLNGLREALASLGSQWSAWRNQKLGATAPTGSAEPATSVEEPGTWDAAVVDGLWTLAAATADDGQQRALDHHASGLAELQDLRTAYGRRVQDLPDADPRRRVRAWLWSEATSGGVALTDAGRDTGFELRLSRYVTPIG